jgi:hypothetical protein
MLPTETSLWLHTAAAISVAMGALWLHLRWHPLRREFSEGWDFVTGLPWFTVLHAVLLLLAQFTGTRLLFGQLDPVDLTSWQDIAGPLATQALFENMTLQHSLLPSWPLALLFPAALALLTWRVMRFPYRYGPRRQRPSERWLLLAGTLLSWGWLALEITHLARPLPEWAEALRLGQRLLFQAIAMAFSQIVLLRLIIAWIEPEHPDDQRDLGLALEHTFARWRGVAGLAVLDLLILLMQGSTGGLSRWMLLEVMLVFLALPAAIARVPGPLSRQGMAALRVWRRAFFSLLGVLLTGLFLLALVRYASATLLTLTGPETWQRSVLLPVHALVLATARNWVFLASVLTLLRHGLPPSSARGHTAS